MKRAGENKNKRCVVEGKSVFFVFGLGFVLFFVLYEFDEIKRTINKTYFKCFFQGMVLSSGFVVEAKFDRFLIDLSYVWSVNYNSLLKKGVKFAPF